MSRLFVLAALVLAGCPSAPDSFEEDKSRAEGWLRKERFGLVLSHVDDWLRNANAAHNAMSARQFRLVKAAALLGAERSASEALTLLTAKGDVPAGDDHSAYRAQSLILQARATYSLGRTQEVPALLDRAGAAASQANRPDLAAEVALRRGFLLRDNGKFPEAHGVFENLLAESQRLRDRYLEARAENSLATLLVAESRYDEAIPLLERSRSVALEADAVDTAARVQGNLGVCYFRLGDYDNARANFDAARAEFFRAGNQYEVQIWTGSTANVSKETGDLQGAINSYQQALGIARQVKAPVWTGRWLSNLASASITRKEWDAAEKYNNEARQLKTQTHDEAYQATSLINAAQIAAGRSDLDGSRDLFNDALKKHSEDPTVVLEAHAGLAGLYTRRGMLKDAEAEYQNTIAQIDNRQSKLFKDEFRLSWLDSLIRFYQNYVDFLIAQNQPERALAAAESSRSKVLTGQPIRQLAASGFRQLAHQTGAVLLEYWLGPDHSYLWVITPDNVFTHELPAKNELLPLVRTYRAVVTADRNPLDVAADTGLRLYNALLAPAMRDAGSATQFIIVPDDELYAFNFETLPDGNNSNRYWIDRATVRITPSLNYLAANARQTHEKANPKLLLIGNPVSSLAQYPSLKFASQEMDEVAGAMSSVQPVVFQGSAATPDSYSNARPGDFGFIHFTAHAAAAAKRESALDSAVILSGPPDRYRLAARDVLAVPLNAELVTVSACRSAGGKTYGGEGLVGFAWAFMKAGAGNVIAGLWDVNDQSTVRLMGGLYGQIAKGAPVAEALRSSKLALIHGGGSFAKPHYWAPFQLYTGRPR